MASLGNDTSVLVKYLRRAVRTHGTGVQLIYRDLVAGFRQAISDGVLASGTPLPGERELGLLVGVSRTSIRKAVQQLVDEGALIRRHGARTAVAARVEKPLSRLTSFSEDMRSRGLAPGMVWMSKEVGVASPAEIMALNLSVGQKVIRLRRLRTGDDVPMALEFAVVPASVLRSPDDVTGSLYDRLDEQGFRPVRALQRLRAAVAGSDDAELLQISIGAPLLIAERRCFASDGKPVEFTETRYSGERYDFIAELKAGSEDTS